MRIAIGADHAGYVMKDAIGQYLRNAGHEVLDFGTDSPEAVDYPDYALAIGKAIQSGDADRGVLVCGSGAGITVAANKMKGIRAALCEDAYTAHQCVEHDDVNVFCIGSRVIANELALDLLRIWLSASFTGEERHVRRLSKIQEMESTEG